MLPYLKWLSAPPVICSAFIASRIYYETPLFDAILQTIVVFFVARFFYYYVYTVKLIYSMFFSIFITVSTLSFIYVFFPVGVWWDLFKETAVFAWLDDEMHKSKHMQTIVYLLDVFSDIETLKTALYKRIAESVLSANN